MADETVHFAQKSREIRGGGKWKAIRLFASKPSLAYSFPLDAVCVWHAAVIAAVLWSWSTASLNALHISTYLPGRSEI